METKTKSNIGGYTAAIRLFLMYLIKNLKKPTSDMVNGG